ncbi:hypothetical protein TASIC1_0007005000 [Trichoderma asperellum]|uniref:Uncharacterized protein n=1 Tax=Trichoderma asperellum TaxID=101201 RepID=A0A6V8R0J1_TRIAP|nr:hypothetical protein TASIC1_0007005000 [Trichoderma asperellum]
MLSLPCARSTRAATLPPTGSLAAAAPVTEYSPSLRTVIGVLANSLEQSALQLLQHELGASKGDERGTGRPPPAPNGPQVFPLVQCMLDGFCAAAASAVSE